MIHLGRHSYNYGVQKGNGNDVHIGAFSSIAEDVIFDGGFNHDVSFISTFPFSTIWSEEKSNIKIKGDINIGNDVWIGTGAIIMSGVTIADGCIIGSRSIITKNIVLPYSIVVGSNEYKGFRFNLLDRQREKLFKISWWEWSDEKIKENVHLLQSNNIDEFIKKHYDTK